MRLAVALAVLLLGCESTTKRCERISYEDLANRIDQRYEDMILRRIEKSPHAMTYPRGSRREQDSIRRLVGDDIVKDTTQPRVAPPPRPSDVKWYEEHCYEGRPR
jgi:hypothetical protein